MDGYVFVWNLNGSVCMDISGPISRVQLKIHHNPRFVESGVGKTLVCIR